MTTLPGLERELVLAAHRARARPLWRRFSRRTGTLTVIAAVLVATGTAAATQLPGSPIYVGTPTVAPPNPGVVQSLGARQRTLDALRQPASPSTTLPTDTQANISGETIAGENPRLGRKALTTAWGDTFWVVPAADGKVCLLVNSGSGGCSPASQVEDGTFNGVAPCHKGGAVYDGLLPNGATNASVTLDDGGTRALAIISNVWAIQIPLDKPQPTTISWTQNGTTRHAQTSPLPPPGPLSLSRCGE